MFFVWNRIYVLISEPNYFREFYTSLSSMRLVSNSWSYLSISATARTVIASLESRKSIDSYIDTADAVYLPALATPATIVRSLRRLSCGPRLDPDVQVHRYVGRKS